MSKILKNELWAIACLIVALWVLNYNLFNRLDVISDDDDLYYMLGMDYLKGNYRDPDFGPIYCFWQIIIQLITKNPITTFYVNWILLTILPCVAFYTLMRSFNVKQWVSVMITVLYMYSDLHFPLTPKLTHFAITFLGIGAAYVNRSKPLIYQVMIGGITLLLSSYIRPEMYIAVFIVLAWLLFLSYKNKSYKYMTILALSVAFSALILGSPMRQNDRSFWTFKHHFSINYISWYPETNLSPWNHFNEITTKAFGHQLKSPTDAFKSNPDLVFRHITENIKGLFKTTFMYVKNIFFDQLNQTFAFPHRKYLLLAVCLGIVLLLDFRRTFSQLKDSVEKNKIGWIFIVLMLIPSLISTTLIYPRQHYVLYHFLFHLPFIGTVLSNLSFKKIGRTIQPSYLGAIGTLILLLFLYPRFLANSKNQPTPFREFALMLQSLHLEGKVTVFGGDVPFTYPRYAGENWELLYFDIFRPSHFEKFIEEKNVNCVIINNKMDNFFKNDSSYQAFLHTPLSIGFNLIKQTDKHSVYYKNVLK